MTPEELAYIACTFCTDPGRCCREFGLGRSFWEEDTEEDVRKWLDEEELPFEPLRSGTTKYVDDETGKRYVTWLYDCPKLEDGRCSIYEDRPYMCKKYQPARDGLCVFGPSGDKEKEAP